MLLTHSDIAEIIRIVDRSTLDELVIEVGDLKVEVRRKGATTSPPPVASTPSVPMASTPAPSATVAAASPSIKPRAGEKSTTGRAGGPTARDGGAPVPAPGPVVGQGQIAIRSPMVGTFYRRPAPDDPPYVEAGGEVEADTPLCLVEVMKLYTTIYAKTRGRIARICADDAELVEYDQILFIIDPT